MVEPKRGALGKASFDPLWRVARERSSTDPAHDYLHVKRVWQNAQRIMSEVEADNEIVTPAILLHELFNYPKGHPDSKLSGDVCAEEAAEVLQDVDYPTDKREQILDCIRFHSFSRGVVPTHIEGKVVQDADRLDSLGAIGIARTFATCAEMKRPFYEAGDPFAQSRSLDDKVYGLDHFYVKLFKLTDGMHTEAARRIATKRTEFMRTYIEQLGREI